MATTADRLALLQRTKAGQRALLEEMYPELDFSTVPFREYGRLFTGRKYVPGFAGGWKSYGRSNSEDASTRDILPDYSGNGRDIKLYNFAFSGMSGWGGYGSTWDAYGDTAEQVNSNTVKIRSTRLEGVVLQSLRKGESFTVCYRITGLPSGSTLDLYTNTRNSENTIVFRSIREIEKDGTYTDTVTWDSENAADDTTISQVFLVGRDATYPEDMTVLAEQLPLYPGALVSDGVDDYGQCIKGFSLPDDYTVVALRKIITGNNAAIASKGATVGAFLFDGASGGNNVAAWSYGYQNSLNNLPALFSYQTKTSYNGTAISFGTQEDSESDLLKLFTHNNSSCAQAVLYDLRIYDHTLTAEELAAVKDEMMSDYEAATGGGIADITYVADWDGKDRSNEEDEPMRSQWVDKKTGKVINLHNYAFAGMSGWNGYANDFSAWNKAEGSNYDNSIVTASANQINVSGTIAEGKQAAGVFTSYIQNGETVRLRIKVSGLQSGQYVRIANELNGGGDTNIESDGVTDLTLTSDGTSYGNVYILVYGAGELDVTIEQLPLYPGALVSDGVDDYGVTQEAINEEVGTMLVYARLIDESAGGYYILNTNNSPEDNGRLYLWRSENGKYAWGLPNKSGDNPPFILTREPLAPNLVMYIASNYSPGYYSACFVHRIIIIREQLDDAQVEFLRWKVEKEYRDWLIRMGLYEEEIPWYGIEFDTTDSSPDVKRIGNMEMHRTLPVQSQMRGCLLNDDGTVAKYLDAADWTSETRDGSAGQVMVEMPKDAYWRFETWGTKRRVKFATTALPGFTRTPQGYDSAYEASVQRSASKLCSVVNTDADYRGGNNSSDRDGTYRSQLGLPATAISRTNFRTYARNRNADSSEWNCMTYDFQKLVYWLFAVEYATLNTQKTFNADRDADGLAQGGLGVGVTTVNYNRWHNFNGAYPFIPCGHTDSLGNGTGQIQFTMPFEYDASPSSSTGLGNNYVGEYLSETAYTSGQFVSQGEDLYECISDTEAGTPLTDTIHFSKVTRTAVQVPRYRGLENPFGHIWQWTDGINVRISPDSDNGGDGLSKVFVTDNPEYFNDSNYDNMSYIGNETRSNGYIKEIIFGEGGEIMPSVVGGSSTTYFCDYHYTNIPATETLRGVLFGGNADYGAAAGFGSASSAGTPSHTNAYFGSRLCFIPEKA